MWELDLVPVDICSPLDNSGSKKQGVSFTYKKHDGYAPIFAYVGTEGHMLAHELRPGKQHCQEGTPQFIGSYVDTLKRLGLGGRCLLRLDSGNDAEENFGHFGVTTSSPNAICAKRNRSSPAERDGPLLG